MCIRLTKGYVLSSKLKVKDEKQDTKNINIEKNVLDEKPGIVCIGRCRKNGEPEYDFYESSSGVEYKIYKKHITKSQ